MKASLPLVPDYSYLSTLASCPRKHYWRYIRRIRSEGSSMPMIGGSAMHAALHVLYNEGWSFAPARDALEDAYVREGGKLGGLGVNVGKHSYLTLEHLELVLRNYMDEREERPTALEDGAADIQFAEEALTFEWTGPSGEIITVGGKPDYPRKIGERRYIVDHKCTTGWVNDHWALRFRLGYQFRIYVAALQALTGASYSGAYVNAIYIGEKAADPAAKWKNRKSAPTVLFGPYNYTPAEIAEAWQWAQAWMQTEQLYTKLGFWPANENACQDYGGCSYLDLCSRSPKVREAVAQRQYEEWVPLGVLASGADGSTTAREAA